MRALCGSLILGAGGLIAVAAIGCVMGPGGRVAEQWELVGPFKAFAPKKPAPPQPSGQQDRRATQPPEGGARLPSQSGPSQDLPDQAPGASSNGVFSLRVGQLDFGSNGTEPVGPAINPAEHSLFAPVPGVEDTFWYLDLGFRMGITRLHSTEDRLDRRLNDPLKLDAFGVFEHPTTPIDRKSDFALTTAYIGIGWRETEWLTWNFYLGSGVGGDRDHQRWLNSNLEVNFDYALYYTGMTVDVYPWGLARRGRYADFKEHLKAGRPYLVTGIEIGYLRARGWGHFALAPITLYSDSQRIEDWLFSYLVGCGWEVPINERWAFNLSVHYTFHFYRPEEYNGWNVTYALRYRF
ncbi:MAG: hypothetical protein V2A79_11355 [Planctomycetota bacterium]